MRLKKSAFYSFLLPFSVRCTKFRGQTRLFLLFPDSATNTRNKPPETQKKRQDLSCRQFVVGVTAAKSRKAAAVRSSPPESAARSVWRWTTHPIRSRHCRNQRHLGEFDTLNRDLAIFVKKSAIGVFRCKSAFLRMKKQDRKGSRFPAIIASFFTLFQSAPRSEKF